MISLCTVTLNRLSSFLNTLCESIVDKLKLVDEVIINNVESTASEKTWQVNGIKFIEFGGKHDLFKIYEPNSFCAQHAYGLYQCSNKTKNNLVLFCDPDIFFYNNIDEFYLELMEKYSLNLIGVSHPNSVSAAISFFPTAINCLLKKDELPPDDYPKQYDLKEILHSDSSNFEDIKGKYWFPGCPIELRNRFPKPSGHYETGSNLLLWSLEQNWRWLSFQTGDCHLYGTRFHKANFKISEKFKKRKLLYHASLASGNHNRLETFTQAYEELKNEPPTHGDDH